MRKIIVIGDAGSGRKYLAAINKNNEFDIITPEQVKGLDVEIPKKPELSLTTLTDTVILKDGKERRRERRKMERKYGKR